MSTCKDTLVANTANPRMYPNYKHTMMLH